MELLAILDALVRRDGHPPTLRGKVSIGVRSPDGYRFWSARFGKAAETSTGTRMPSDSDVTLFLDEADAQALLVPGNSRASRSS